MGCITMIVKSEVKIVCRINAGPPPFRYACRDCRKRFQMPSPTGPTEERNRCCPACGSRNLRLFATPGGKPCPPGG